MAKLLERSARITTKGQVTIPVEIRRALGVGDGDLVTFRSTRSGSVVLASAKKPTLAELLAAFDPSKHRRGLEDRPWDDAPAGGESI